MKDAGALLDRLLSTRNGRGNNNVIIFRAEDPDRNGRVRIVCSTSDGARGIRSRKSNLTD